MVGTGILDGPMAGAASEGLTVREAGPYGCLQWP